MSLELNSQAAVRRELEIAKIPFPKNTEFMILKNFAPWRLCARTLFPM
jgi:hypothetical protein